MKALRILEVPIYLLVIALFCIENEATGMGIFLMAVSVGRLWTNHITDDTIYKQKKGAK